MKWILKTEKQESSIDAIIDQLLKNRGIKTKSLKEAFIHRDSLGDPFLFPDMQKFVSRIKQAKRDNEKVVIHGDYDVDGVCATAIMYLYLSDILHIDTSYYIPNRFHEGYGLSKQTIDSFIEEKKDLLISVDCGIKDIELVDYATSHGLDVIISDHHTPEKVLPHAEAVIHPMGYSDAYLCGAAVAFKMIQALDSAFELSHALEFLDLAALGTICDVMQLQGENRVIVKKALPLLRTTKRKGLEALYAKANIQKSEVDVYHIGFVIGPRLNASGRLDSAYASLGLLIAQTDEEAEQHAQNLQNLNKRRQEEMAAAIAIAQDYLEKESFSHVVYIPHISLGVIGLVAGRITEMTYKPSIVFTDDQKEGILAGSARSIDEINIVTGFEAHRDLFISFGGHAKAAGMKLTKDNFPRLKEKFESYTKQLLQEKLIEKSVVIDMPLAVENISLKDLYRAIEQLEPFGEGNAKPVFSLD